MPRDNAQVFDLDLRGGIESDESPLIIGPKLRASINALWQMAGSQDEQRRRVLSIGPARDLAQQIASFSGSGPILAVISLSVDGDFQSGGVLLTLDPLGNAFVRTLQALDLTASLPESLALDQDRVKSGWAIVWTGIEKSTVYFGHPAFGSVYQHVAPGDDTAVATAYTPAVNPFGSDALVTNSALNPTSISTPVADTGAGETALEADTYKLQITGTNAAGKETDISAESSGHGVSAGDVLQFTVPALPTDIIHMNAYAKKGSGDETRQAKDVKPGVYHLNGNGFTEASSAPIQSFKFLTTSSIGSPDVASLTFAALSAEARIPPEAKLTAATYGVFLVNNITHEHGPATNIVVGSNKVIQFTTPAVSNLALFARKGTSGLYHNQNGITQNPSTPLAASTTYRLNRSGGTVQANAGFIGIQYVPDGPQPNATIPNIVDGIIHLDRLFLLQSAGNGRSTAFYSDPIDPTTMRPINIVPIPFDGTCMFRTAPSAVDVSAASHLVFGGTSSIWVLDGDPTSGNAILRRLTYNIGIADRSCVTETAWGAFILGTDGRFYVIPPGATQLMPLGHLDLATGYEPAAFTARSSFAFVPPYVVYSPAGDTSLYLVDLSPVAAQGAPKWWGPFTLGVTDPDDPLLDPPAGTLIRVSSIVPEAGANQVDRVYYASLAGDVATLDVVVRGSTGTTDGRAVTLRSGYLNVEGHKLELRRIVVEYAQPDADTTVTALITKADGSTTTVSRVFKGIATPAPDLLGRTVWDFSSNPVVSTAFGFDLVWPEATQPDVHRVYVEVRVQPLTNEP